MEKDFDEWNVLKKHIHTRDTEKTIFFREREIWWCMLGTNVGFEQDGKGKMFSRPVLILRKFNQQIFLGIPLSTKIKSNPFYIECVSSNGLKRSAIISQVRIMSVRRLINRRGFATRASFLAIKEATKGML